MPQGPKGEKRLADVIGAAVMVARIATRKMEDNPSKAPQRTKGGVARGLSHPRGVRRSRKRPPRLDIHLALFPLKKNSLCRFWNPLILYPANDDIGLHH
jgi:hypothetical protein